MTIFSAQGNVKFVIRSFKFTVTHVSRMQKIFRKRKEKCELFWSPTELQGLQQLDLLFRRSVNYMGGVKFLYPNFSFPSRQSKANFRLNGPSLGFLFCNRPDSGRHVTSLNQGLSSRAGPGRWKSLGRRLHLSKVSKVKFSMFYAVWYFSDEKLRVFWESLLSILVSCGLDPTHATGSLATPVLFEMLSTSWQQRKNEAFEVARRPQDQINFTYSRAPFVFCNYFYCFTDVAVAVSVLVPKVPIVSKANEQ